MKDQLYAIVSPDKIDILTKFIEAYDHLAIVSTLDRSRGLVIMRSTEDNYNDLQEILANLPFPIEVLTEYPQQENGTN